MHWRIALAEFRERYVDRGRSPADDLLDRARPAAPALLAMETPS
jgi:hypothetical protein